MAGKNCVAVAVDKRFGSGPQTIHISPRTVLVPNSRVMVGFTGLEGDVQSLASELSTLVIEKKGRHLGFGFESGSGDDNVRLIGPKSMSMLLSHVLYGRRRSPYYVQPIVAGLAKTRVSKRIVATGTPDNTSSIDSDIVVEEEGIQYEYEYRYEAFLCAQDVLGAQSTSKSFVCSGAASKSLYGTAEAMWRPNLTPEELVQVCGRAFSSGLERDCLSGYGAIIYLIVGGEGITEIDLACRLD